MINKICNWVFGSFFRTIGRLLVFILLGVIIANLVDFSDIIANFRITDLFFEKVNADTWNTYFMGDLTDINSNQLQFDTDLLYDYVYLERNAGTFYDDTITFSNPIPRISHINYIKLYGILKGISFRDDETITCTNSGSISTCTTSSNYSIRFQVWFGGNTNQCDIQWNMNPVYNSYQNELYFTATCPFDIRYSNNNLFRFRYSIMYPTGGTTGKYKLDLNRNLYILSPDSSAIIDNQNQNTQQQMQQQQQQHQELMDDNTTEADTEGQDFINNFSNNSHGLTGIITAPLNAIQSIASATCSPLVLPLPFMSNKSLTLPCMNSIYTQYFGAFYTMYQGIILALISYWVCVRLFTLVKGFKDPEDDKIEVMDL